MTQKIYKIIFLLLTICSCNLYLSGKDKYLPEEITDNESFFLKIFYDNDNRINAIETKAIFPDSQIQYTRNSYALYPNGLLKEVTSDMKTEPERVAMIYSMIDKYDYQISDTVISITLTKKYKFNDEAYVYDTISSSKIYLNKEKLANKIVSVDGYNNFMTSSDTIEYSSNNQITKIEQTMIDKWGGLHFYTSNEVLESIRQKNVFSDVQKSALTQIPLEKQLFYFFTDEVPTSIINQSKMQEDNDADIDNIKFTYKLDDNGYPIEINITEYKEGKDPKKSTLFVKYKKVSN